MHFFYLDEAGCTGEDLDAPEQPIFVLGGVSVRDEGWSLTQEEFLTIISTYFEGNIPIGFELHAAELLSPKGEGPFQGHEFERRKKLAQDILSLIHTRKHGVHLFGIDKKKLSENKCLIDLDYNLNAPYMVAYDYLLTYINEFVKKKLGSTARGMMLFDEKEQFEEDIRRVTHSRRYEGAAAHRIKRIVEFSRPVDSKRNPMIQISDLVVFSAKKFFEIEAGYRDNYLEEVKYFYAECYKKIDGRISIKTLVPRSGHKMHSYNGYLNAIQIKPRAQWKRRYGTA